MAQPCPAPNTGDECELNTGKAWYKGIEGEGTYAFDNLFGFDVQGLSVFANGALMSSKLDGGTWAPNAPEWTLAGGLLFRNANWKFSLIDKLVGQQFSDTANTSAWRISSYSDLFGSVGYQFNMVELSLTADNILDRRNTTLITINDAHPLPTATSLNQYFFQPPRSLMFAVKVHY